jgi:hypothetical protein
MEEQRMLDEMERQLAIDDPKLAARLNTFGRQRLSPYGHPRTAPHSGPSASAKPPAGAPSNTADGG